MPRGGKTSAADIARRRRQRAGDDGEAKDPISLAQVKAISLDNGIRSISREAKNWVRRSYQKFATEFARRLKVYCRRRKTIRAKDIDAVASGMGYTTYNSHTARPKRRSSRRKGRMDEMASILADMIKEADTVYVVPPDGESDSDDDDDDGAGDGNEVTRTKQECEREDRDVSNQETPQE